MRRPRGFCATREGSAAKGFAFWHNRKQKGDILFCSVSPFFIFEIRNQLGLKNEVFLPTRYILFAIIKCVRVRDCTREPHADCSAATRQGECFAQQQAERLRREGIPSLSPCPPRGYGQNARSLPLTSFFPILGVSHQEKATPWLFLLLTRRTLVRLRVEIGDFCSKSVRPRLFFFYSTARFAF